MKPHSPGRIRYPSGRRSAARSRPREPEAPRPRRRHLSPLRGISPALSPWIDKVSPRESPTRTPRLFARLRVGGPWFRSSSTLHHPCRKTTARTQGDSSAKPSRTVILRIARISPIGVLSKARLGSACPAGDRTAIEHLSSRRLAYNPRAAPAGETGARSRAIRRYVLGRARRPALTCSKSTRVARADRAEPHARRADHGAVTEAFVGGRSAACISGSHGSSRLTPSVIAHNPSPWLHGRRT